MNRELLEKPFDLSQIKQREGNFGKVLDYIEGHAIIQRLNDAFEAEWSFSILKHEVLEKTDEVIVLGQLRAGDVVKTQFGSSKITRARESGEPISLADDLKAAATDCLKKCATLLGIGLHLYNGNTPSTRQQDPQPDNRDNGGRNPHNRSGRPPGNGNGGGRLSSKQYRYILRLNDEAGRSRQDLDRQCQESFGVVAQYLSKADASALIEQMLSK